MDGCRVRVGLVACGDDGGGGGDGDTFVSVGSLGVGDQERLETLARLVLDRI